MNHVKVLEIKQSVFANNDKQADELRDLLKQKHVFLLNLMSSPGSGKTTTLRQTIALKRISTLTLTRRRSQRPAQKRSSFTPAACATSMPP